MSEEYEEDCPECGFNQKDEDEKDEREKKELIEEFLFDLKSIDNNKDVEYKINKWEKKFLKNY